MIDLFEEAEANEVQIEYCRLPLNKSMSAQDASGDFVLLDYALINQQADERMCLAHELGHCLTGGFYSLYAPAEIRAKAERSADRWAIEKLVTRGELYKACHSGCREVWEFAEFFELPQPFVEKALCFYGFL